MRVSSWASFSPTSIPCWPAFCVKMPERWSWPRKIATEGLSRSSSRRFAATMPDVADRVRFVPFQQHADYLCLIAAADVLLDPVHFGGVNTTYDGLSLHKPIVTLPSRFQRGRYTLGCYKKMGIFDCVANDPQEYIDIAVRLGTDLAFRAEIEKRIQLTSPALFEDLEAVREHERIFRALVAEARSARRSEPR